MLVALEAAGSGTSYGTLDISAILIDFTSCFVDLQQLIFKQANSTPTQDTQDIQTKPCLHVFLRSLACASQIRIFAGHGGPELTDINMTPDFYNWSSWLTTLKQNADVVLAITTYDLLDFVRKQVVGRGWASIKDFPVALNDKQCALVLVGLDGRYLQDTSEVLQDDEQVVTAAVKQTYEAFMFASQRLQCQESIALLLLQTHKNLPLPYSMLRTLKKRINTPSFALQAVQIHGAWLYDLEQIDKQTVLCAVSNYAPALQYARDFQTDTDVVRAAMKANIEDVITLMHSVPLIEQTCRQLANNPLETDIAALLYDKGYALMFSNQTNVDHDLMLDQAGKRGWALADSSLRHADNMACLKDVVLAAVLNEPQVLEFAADWLQNDKEVVLEAVALDGLALEYASETLKADKDVVLIAVAQNGFALQYAGETLKAVKDVVLAAVAEDGRALEYASDALKMDVEVVLAAVRQYGMALRYAHVSLRRNPGVQVAAVAQNGIALKYAIDFDEDVVTKAVKQNGLSLQYAAAFRFSKDIVLRAVSQNGNALRYVDCCLDEDPDAIKAALDQSLDVYEYVQRHVTEEMAVSAAQHHGARALTRLPQRLHTTDVVFAALQNQPQALRNVRQADCPTRCSQIELARHFVKCWPGEVAAAEAQLCLSRELCMRIMYEIYLQQHQGAPCSYKKKTRTLRKHTTQAQTMNK